MYICNAGFISGRPGDAFASPPLELAFPGGFPSLKFAAMHLPLLEQNPEINPVMVEGEGSSGKRMLPCCDKLLV